MSESTLRVHGRWHARMSRRHSTRWCAILVTLAFAASGQVILAPGAVAAPSARYIVKFVDGTNAAAVAADLANKLGIVVVDNLEHIFPGAVVDGRPTAIAALRADRRVSVVEPDARLRLSEPPSPVAGSVEAITTQGSPPWGLDRIDQRHLPVSGGYEYPNTAVGLTVYVMDTGIRADHVEFGGRVLAGFTAVIDGHGTDDCDGHGTGVASTVGGATYGVAKAVSLVPVRVFDCDDNSSVSNITTALDWVLGDHVDGTPAVLNMSFGGPTSNAIDDGVRAVIADGIVAVAAAGNEGRNACGGSPARVTGAITVAAVSETDFSPGWSSYGPCVDVFAPGVAILSATNESTTASGLHDGTSLAAPHVTGAIAVMWADQLGLDGETITARLLRNATGDVVSNAGRNTPNRLLYSQPGPPANDAFAAALEMPMADLASQELTTAASGFVDGTNLQATQEAGEPDHAGVVGGQSVWWQFTTTETGPMTLTTDGSSVDTALAVYTGIAVDTSTLVASDDNAGVGTNSLLTFTATAGTTYHVAVDSAPAASGYVKLTFTPPAPPPPVNDDFALATVLSLSGPSPLTGTTLSATREDGEPDHWGSSYGRSAWWTFTMPTTGTVRLSTSASYFDTVVAVYTGDSVNTLSLVADSDDEDESGDTSVEFPGTAGTVFWVAIDGLDGASGAVELHVGPPRPLVTPSEPQAVAAAPRSGAVVVTWQPPATLKQAVLAYDVEYRIVGDFWWSVGAAAPASARRATVFALTNGSTYEFRVTADSLEGFGVPSIPFRTIPGTPLAPRRPSATAGEESLRVTWRSPSSTNGSPVRDYVIRYRVVGAPTWSLLADAVSTVRAATVTGLTPSATYEVAVAAVNARGQGPFSTPSAPLQVPAVPSEPRALVGTPRVKAIALSWLPPTTTNGAPITNYLIEFRVVGALDWIPFAHPVSTSRSRTVTGLLDATTYEFHVAAHNRAGNGAWSDLATATAGAPKAPSTPVVTAGVGQARLSWRAPTSTNGSAVTDYVIQYRPTSTSTWTTFPDAVSATRTAVVTGLPSGVPHVFRVAAVNAHGQGSWSNQSAVRSPL